MYRFFVGDDITSVEDNGRQLPISRVTLKVDDESVLTAGDDTGMELEADCPHATQAMVNAILAKVKGYRYQMFSAGDAGLDPAAELGDGITAGGVYSVISRLSDDGSGFPSVTAPGEAELEDEYPAGGPMSREFDRKIAETRSSITKTAEQIRLEVANQVQGLSSSFTVELNSIKGQVTGLNGQVSTLEQTAESIILRVSGLDASVSTISQTVNSITLGVENGNSSSWIKLYKDGIEVASERIKFKGQVVFEDDLSSGETIISGDCIQTGEVSARYIRLGGAMDVYESLNSNAIGGTLGYVTSYDFHGNRTYGMGMLNYNDNYQVVVTDSGARLTSPTAEVVAAVNITLDTSRKINASTELTITSDLRKKEEVRYDVAEKYLPLLDRLKPCSFLRKDGGDQRHLGFIAQEYRDAETAAGISSEDSVIIGKTDGFYGLTYGEFIPLLVAKIQELNNRVKELESWKS
ncbi:tail fiber domain-containing protein [Oscillibacter sp. 1-3]|uniref:tail fiber domain-containing protein n=1 Tax=Oscillibacter sp. 1-3 TaxID=1235797 RepID=UPI00033FD8D6|nr:tail fiber domain-containing protein [Oscillibacter sp. 1-3]EOS62526.1 hypothetical protein C816_04179 [Oscillibacter sp. 1-3]